MRLPPLVKCQKGQGFSRKVTSGMGRVKVTRVMGHQANIPPGFFPKLLIRCCIKNYAPVIIRRSFRYPL